MPEPRDGNLAIEPESLKRFFDRESPDPTPREDDLSGTIVHSKQAAGESTDVIADDTQEPDEDGSAPEEESVQAAGRALDSALSSAFKGELSNSYTSSSVSDGPRGYEAGESPDAITDSTQFGEDNRADRAEERANHHDDIQRR